MSQEGIELTVRDYYLLGTLAEERVRHGDKVLKQYTAAEVERLVRGGYLRKAVASQPDETQPIWYGVTGKGWAAWQAYRFCDLAPVMLLLA
jgi:hypothetical protein